MKKKLAALIAGMALASVATAAPTLYVANGHYYDFVTSAANFTFAEALADAATLSHAGWTGYLATVTDAGENAFINTSVTTVQAWIAATDAAVEGSYRWVAGPEAGSLLVYTNWEAGEPNNCCGGENEAVINWGSSGTWNDIGNPAFPTYRVGYIVEFSAPTGVPEPGSLALALVALAGVGFAKRRKA